MTWLARNIPRNVGAAAQLKLEGLPLLHPTATWYALATHPSTAAVRTASTSTKSVQLWHRGSLSGVTRRSFFHSRPQSFLTLSSPISDTVGSRTLPFPVGVPSNTMESCTSACYDAGYSIAGTEYSAECWCGTSIQGGGAPAAASDCNMPCSGDNTQSCGGPNRLNLYNYTGTVPTPPPPPGTVTVHPVTNLPGNWSYNGCWM